MSEPTPDHVDDRLAAALRSTVPEGPDPAGRADSVVRRGRRTRLLRGITSVLALGVVSLAVVTGQNPLDIRDSPNQLAGSRMAAAIPKVCPLQPSPLPSGVPPWSALNLVNAEACVYADDRLRPTGPTLLPRPLVASINRDYVKYVVNHPDPSIGLGLEPTVVLYGQTTGGQLVGMSQYSGAFNRGPVSWQPSPALQRRIDTAVFS